MEDFVQQLIMAYMVLIDDEPNKCKLSQVGWDQLTMPKKAEGRDFRDIETFNDFLVAKQSW